MGIVLLLAASLTFANDPPPSSETRIVQPSLIFGVGVNGDAGVVGQIVIAEKNFDLGRK